MKAVKILATLFVAYVAIVVVFESFLGFFQPRAGSTIVITTIDEGGVAEDRVVTPVEDGDQLYVSANHWPRSWYKRALKNPNVQVTADGQTSDYVAVPIPDAEDDRLQIEHAHPLAFRILTGFPPRSFLRLDPR